MSFDMGNNTVDLAQHMVQFHNTASTDANYHSFLHNQNKDVDHKHDAQTGEVIVDHNEQEPSYVLRYMEDLKAGDIVVEASHEHDDEDEGQSLQMSGPFAVLMQHQRCKTVYKKNIVQEVRNYEQMYAVIVVNEDGKQEPMYGPSLQLIRVAVD